MDMFDFNFARIWNAVKQHWIVGLAIFLTLGSLLTVRMLNQQSVYLATCTMEFSAKGPEVSLDNRTLWRYSSYVLQNLFLTGQRIIMLSDPVLDRVVTVVDPSQKIGTPGFESLRRQISGSLSIERVPDSQIFTLRARHTNPKMARDIANATAETYIRYTYEKKIESYRTSMQWLDEELADIKAKLELAQRDLIDFIEKNKITQYGSDDNNTPIVDKRFVEIEGLLERLHARKVEEEIKLDRLKEKYLPAHPDYKATVREIALLEQKMKEEEQRLAVTKKETEQSIIQSKKAEIEYSILKREVEVNKEIYNALVRKHKETDIGSAITGTEASIIEYAKIPKFPSYPNKRAQGTLAWIVGLLFGIGYCVLREITDTSLKSPGDIEKLFSSPLLAAVPREKEKKEGIYPIVDRSAPSEGEPFRVLRTNLNFSFPDLHDGRILMIGSTDKGEGKSTVSYNLAAVSSEQGKKTLIVDGDLRARSLTRFFNLDEKPGLTNVLVGELRADQAIQETDHENMFVLGAGPTPPRPATLVDSEAMSQFLDEMRDQFDEIIIDTPPMSLVIDGNIIASLSDGVVVVVGASKVSRSDLGKTISNLETSKAKVVGFVFNMLDIGPGKYGRHAGYGRYYGAYGYGEQTSEEVDTKKPDSADKRPNPAKDSIT